MSTTSTFTSREFNQNTSEAKKATAHGPVFITDRGKPSHVLLSIDEYQQLTACAPRIADLLWMPGADSAELEIQPSRETARSASLG